LLANHSRDLQAIFPGVLYPSVGNVERVSPGSAQDLRGLSGFAGAIFGVAARSHLAPGEIEDSGAVPALRHFEQGPAASLLHVITVSGKGENVERSGGHVSRERIQTCWNR
jgi:hypothetical protein